MLTLIGVDFLGVRFGVGSGKIIPPLSKTPENYARNRKLGTNVQTHIQNKRTNTHFQNIYLLVPRPI